MAPEPEVLKRKRSRPSDWWAASPAASTSTTPRHDKPAPVQTAGPVPKAPKAPVEKEHPAAPEREGLKRKRSRPSDWWAASPSTSQLQQTSSSANDTAGTSGKRAIQEAPSAVNTGKASKSGGEDKTNPVRLARVSDAQDNIQNKENAEKKRRGRPATSQIEEPDPEPGTPKKRGRPPAPQAQDIDEPVKAAKQGRRGRFSNTEAEVEEVTKEATAAGLKGKGGRPSLSHVEKESRVEKTNERKAGRQKPGQSSAADDGEEHRGRRRSRRSDAEREEEAPLEPAKEVEKKRGRPSGEVVRVESATATFGKARGRPPKPTEVAPEPKSKNHGEQSSSGSSKLHVSSKSSGKAAGRTSDTDIAGRKRKSMEKSKEDTHAKRRRVDETAPDQEVEKQRKEKRPKYQHLATLTRNVSTSTIEAKWEPLNARSIEYISDLLIDVQKPVLARLKEEHKRTQASSSMKMASHKLLRMITKGLPFPPSTRPQREDDFDFEKIIDHIRTLETQLTPTLHADELLENELRKETDWLESDKAILAKLEANAKAAASSRKQAERKLHPVLQSEDSMMDEQDSGFSQRPVVPISGILEDENLRDIVHGVEGHMESMQGNLKQVEGVSEAIAKSKAAVQATLFDHLDGSKYEEVVLGFD